MLRRFFPFTISQNAGYEPEYQAVLDRASFLGYTTPDSTTNDRNNLRVKYLKLEGFWDKLDLLYLFDQPSGCGDFAKLNYIDPDNFEVFNATPANEPTFVDDTGYESNGSKWFSTGYNPSTNGINLFPNGNPSSNGASVFFKGFNFTSDGLFESIFGSRIANDTSQFWYAKLNNTQFLQRVASNDPAIALTPPSLNNHMYFSTGDLRSGSVSKYYEDGVSLGSGTVLEGSSFVNQIIYLFAANLSGTASNIASSGLSYFGLGASIDVVAADKKEVELYEIMSDTYTP